MLPSDKRLVDGIRRALGPLRAPERSEEDRKLVASIDLALNELALRQDTAFIENHIRRGALYLPRGTFDPESGGLRAAWDRLWLSLEGRIDQLNAQTASDLAGAEMAEIVDWENALHARRLTPAALSDVPEQRDRFSLAALTEYLSRRWPDGRYGQVISARTLAGGFSKTTVMFDVETDQGTCSLVLRAAQKLDLIFLDGAKVEKEFHALRYAFRNGLPVPEPLWLEVDKSIFDAPFMVMRRAHGRNFGSRIDVSETISEDILRDMMGNLVSIHATKFDPSDADFAQSHLASLTRKGDLTNTIRAQIALWDERSANFGLPASPILKRALGWLEANVPQNSASPVLLHGDYGLHNLLIDEGGRVSSILDWEASSIGDPADDLVWLANGLKGKFERDRIFALYAELSGAAISKERIHYFDVMGSVRFAVTCGRALYLFETHEEVGLDALQLGLIYMFYGSGTLNQDIGLAERARRA